MATSPSTSSAPPEPPDPPPAGLFVSTAATSLLLMAEDETAALVRDVRGSITPRIPWQTLANLRLFCPEESGGIVIAGWDGVGRILDELEAIVGIRLRRT